jgi:PAS domain S-box-containing protein
MKNKEKATNKIKGMRAAKRASKELKAIKQPEFKIDKYSESIINTIREPLVILDPDLKVIAASCAFYEFFKVKPEDTRGRLIYNLGNQQWNIPKLRKLLETILPQKKAFDNYEVDHEFATIGRRVMLLNARQVKQVLGKERIILLAIEDITERKRLEILLSESEELYRGVFKTASDGIMLLEKHEGKIIHVNPAAEKMLGYSTKECVGNKLQDIGFMLDRGDFQAIMQKLNKNSIINYVDVPVKTKSGQHIIADIYLVDKTKIVQCNIRDISDRFRAKEALKAISSHQEALLSAIPDIIVETDIHKVYTWANAAGYEFFGGDVIGKEAAFYFIGEQNTYTVVEPLFRGDERVIYVESWQRRCDGEKRLLAWRSRGLKDGSGNVTGTVSSAHDITEIKLAEKRIKSSLVEKEILLKEVHHRVKNNLMVIISLIKMEETKADNEMFNPSLQELEGRIRSMAQVHGSLYLSADLAYVDLQTYLETMGAQISAQFGTERNIRFSVQAVGVEVDLDIAISCGLILNELITNAYKHAFPENKPRSGAARCEINVNAGHDGDELTLTVANNGVELPAALDWEKSDTLGLRLINMLIKQINGSIELDRSAGTAFVIKFPSSRKKSLIFE